MTGTGFGDGPPESGSGDGDLDIQITPVDDEFATPSRQGVHTRKNPLIERDHSATASALANRIPHASSGLVPRRIPLPEHEPPPVAARSVPREYFQAMVSTLLVWIFGMTFLVQPVTVPTGSMLNTILVEDHLLVNRFVFGGPTWIPGLPYRPIRRGDIIVFKHPDDPQTLYVKRVVGMPGETIEVYGTRVYINSAELAENKMLTPDATAPGQLQTSGDARLSDGAAWTVYYSQLRDLGDPDDSELSTLASVDHGQIAVGKPFTIPEGAYFCMGDNRDNSEDSRFWGTVPVENIIGRAMIVYWSIDRSDDAPPQAFDGIIRARWRRIGTLLK